MLKNPGIPQHLFDNFLKSQFGKGSDIVENDDNEAVATRKPKNRMNSRKQMKYGP